MQKWLNRSVCYFGESDSWVEEPCIRWGSDWEGALLIGVCWPIVTYLRMSTLHIICLHLCKITLDTCSILMLRMLSNGTMSVAFLSTLAR